MISSAALPNVAFSRPPTAGPERDASCSVPRPIRPASGTSDAAAVRNSHGESCAVTPSTHDTGASTSSALTGDERRLRSIATDLGSSLVAELLEVLVVGAGQQVEECVETAIERAPQLRNGAVEGVKGESGGRAVGELQRRIVDAFQRAFGDQPDAVDQRVSGHPAIIQGD